MPPEQWLKFEMPADLANGLTGEVGDPAPVLVLLRDAATAARKAGADRIRGTQTTRYAVRLDIDRYAATLTPRARSALEYYGVAGKITADVWVDAQDRLRRLHFSLDSNVPAGTAGEVRGRATIEHTIELFDFGVPVQVTSPPASQVCDKPVCGSLSGGP